MIILKILIGIAVLAFVSFIAFAFGGVIFNKLAGEDKWSEMSTFQQIIYSLLTGFLLIFFVYKLNREGCFHSYNSE